MVMISPFQVEDPGSIPGIGKLFFFVRKRKNFGMSLL